MVHWADAEETHQGEENVTIPPRYREVRSFLLSSTAYQLLLQRARCAARLIGAKRGAMEDISKAMSSTFACLRKHSKGTFTHDVHFVLEWDLPGFMRSQAYDTCREIAMESAITITGSSSDAQALTCLQYMDQVWPSTGREILRVLQRAALPEWTPSVSCLKSPIADAELIACLADGTKVEIKFGQSQVSVTAHGCQPSLTELSEQLAWLASALRHSPIDVGVTTSTPHVEETFIAEDGSSAYVHISFIDTVLNLDSDVAAASTASCWHGMFRNPTIVDGFPILAREFAERGLQLPFKMLSTLAETHHLTRYDSAMLLKGAVTMLVATGQTVRSMTWHFLHNEDGTRMRYPTFKFRCGKWLTAGGMSPRTIDSEDTSHYVGWCSDITRHFGISQPCLANFVDINYSAGAESRMYEGIEYAGAKKCSAGFAVEQKLTISASRYIGFSGAVVRGNRDRAEFAKYAGYSTQIEFARQMPTVSHRHVSRNINI